MANCSTFDTVTVSFAANVCADLIALGKDKARAGYMVSVDAKDCTHTTKAGAKRYAGFFVEEAKGVLPDFANWLK